jgi:hypothetical protein
MKLPALIRWVSFSVSILSFLVGFWICFISWSVEILQDYLTMVRARF